jgi:hypothetical protein
VRVFKIELGSRRRNRGARRELQKLEAATL